MALQQPGRRAARSAARSPTSRATTRRSATFPADYEKYNFIDVTRQQVGKDPNVKHSGESVLRGPMPTLKQSTAKAGKATAVGQTVLQPPQ